MSLSLDIVYSSLALDVNLAHCTVQCTYQATDGSPMAGEVSFTPAPKYIADPDTGTIFFPSPVRATLDSNGSISAVLIATDNPALNPTGWTYTVDEALTRNGEAFTNSYSIKAPSNSLINLADEIPVSDYTGTPIVRGRPGPAGTDVEVVSL